MMMLRAFLVPAIWALCTWSLGRTCVVPAQGSITKALAHDHSCDTIVVRGGMHAEGTILIDRPMVLIGEGWPVVDGGGKGEVIVVNSSHVTITGFVVRGTAVSDMNDNAGIKCISVSDVRITGNRIEGCFFGVYLSSVARASIRDNRVMGDASTPENRRANGIHLWKCAHVHVVGNIVQYHRDGIYLEFVTDSRVDHDSSAYNTRYGLHFMFSHRDAYTHNVFHGNGAGVAVMFTNEVTITDNHFEQNRGASAYGLLLKELNDAHIERNVFTDNTVGLFVDGCNRATVVGNTFMSNGWAVKLFANSTGCTFQNNTFLGNTFDMSTNGDLVLSSLTGNYWDRYRGYDLDRDGNGDVPHHPMSMFGMVAERMPYAMVLSRSLMVNLLDQSERIVPTMTPVALEDKAPLMRPPATSPQPRDGSH